MRRRLPVLRSARHFSGRRPGHEAPPDYRDSRVAPVRLRLRPVRGTDRHLAKQGVRLRGPSGTDIFDQIEIHGPMPLAVDRAVDFP